MPQVQPKRKIKAIFWTLSPIQRNVEAFRISTIEKVIYIYIYFFFRDVCAYRSSQARGQVGATAAGLCHSHSNTVSECVCNLHTAHGNAGSLTQWARPGIKPASSWLLVIFHVCYCWATIQTPKKLFYARKVICISSLHVINYKRETYTLLTFL